MKAKKAWSKPKLVVLLRGKPGEMVLGGCKGGPGAGYGTYQGQCSIKNGAWCITCTLTAGS